VLVNNAGIDPPGTVVEIPHRAVEKDHRYQPHRPVSDDEGRDPRHDQNGGGSIINISSWPACAASPPCPPTQPRSRASRPVAGDGARLRRAKIRVNVVCPARSARRCSSTP
jgi:NAD(P)-dependent dehydrogenase (short-subunit alcohol dehydrogenase family)